MKNVMINDKKKEPCVHLNLVKESLMNKYDDFQEVT